MKVKLTLEDKNILQLALEQLDKYYEEREKTCRDFKWICHDYLPQHGEGFLANINVFEIQDKTIKDILNAKEQARKTIMKLINSPEK